MSYLHHIQQCNQYHSDHFISFKYSGVQVGKVIPDFAKSLLQISDSFSLEADGLNWKPSSTGFTPLNKSMSDLTDQLLEAKLLPYRHGELYPVTTGDRNNVLFLMDRALVPFFGVAAFGQHLNGFIRRDGEIHMWISRRSQLKRYSPGKLDNFVAGGLPWGLTLEENLAKECWEEAGIPAELSARAKLVSSISYRRENEKGVKPDTMYCYDLELPEDFIPHCTDGEVEDFQLWPLEKVAQIVSSSSDFKLNCNLVIIDFLIRHDYISTNHHAYNDLVVGLNAKR